MKPDLELSADEVRMLRLYRCLSRRQKREVSTSIMQTAMERWLPFKNIYDLLPADLFRSQSVLSDKEYATPMEHVRWSMDSVDGVEERVAGPSYYDRDTARALAKAASFLRPECWPEPLSEQHFIILLHEWRSHIVAACELAKRRAASTAAEAAAQNVAVPANPSQWIKFALSLDGEDISEELGLDEQEDGEGYGDNDTEPSPLKARLALHRNLRLLQQEDREPTEADLTEIQEILQWLREHQAAGNGTGEGPI